MENIFKKIIAKINSFDTELFVKTHNSLLSKLSNKNPAYLEKFSFLEIENFKEDIEDLLMQTKQIIKEMELEFELGIEMIEDNLFLLIKTISIIENKPLKQIMKELFEYEQ